MKRFWMLLCMIALFAAGAVALANSNFPVQAQLSTINLSVDPAVTTAGLTFDVPVKMNIPKELPVKGWQFVLSFDPKLLKLNSVKQGELFTRCLSADRTFYFSRYPMDEDNGKVGVVEAGLGGPHWAGCSGSGVIAVLNFTALGKGAPTYLLSSIEFVDPQARAYKLFQYSVNGALRQNVDEAKLAAQIQEATQVQEDYLNSGTYKKRHYTPSADELAAATELAYFRSLPFHTSVAPTPVLFAFQSPEDILNAITNDPYLKQNADYYGECIEANSPGTPIFVKELQPGGEDYYLVPFNRDSRVCFVALFTVWQDGKGSFGAGWLDRSGKGIDIPPITSDEAIRLVQNAGFEVKGEPRLVDKLCHEGCDIFNPQWEVPTADGQNLYVVFDYSHDTNAPVILTPKGIIIP